jgi:putative transposase
LRNRKRRAKEAFSHVFRRKIMWNFYRGIMPGSETLQSGVIYHIYNRGNNREDIFIEPRNYRFFLTLYRKHVCPVVDTFAFCLMRNHFHLLVRIKADSVDGPAHLQTLSSLQPSRSFANCFNAYTKAMNKMYQRTGALFQRPFQRIAINSDTHLLQLVTYIHHNPQRHGFTHDFRTWPYSSYDALTSATPTFLSREEVLTWYGDLDSFKAAHALEFSH